MTLYPDPFSDGVIDADPPWEPLRGLPADDEYWAAMEPMRPRQHEVTRAEWRRTAA